MQLLFNCDLCVWLRLERLISMRHTLDSSVPNQNMIRASGYFMTNQRPPLLFMRCVLSLC